MKYEFDMEKGKPSYSGLEIVRRDNCKLLKKTQTEFFEKLLVHIDPRGAVGKLLENIKDLMTGKVPMDLLVISKKLAKAKYANPQPHQKLNERIAEREPTLVYKVGARIPFCYVAGPAPLNERAEDPQFIKDNCLAIDRKYYLEKQIMKPMERLLVPLFGGKNTKLFFERAQQGAIHTHFKSNKADWIPPLLCDSEEEKPSKKRKEPPAQKNTMMSYFKKGRV